MSVRTEIMLDQPWKFKCDAEHIGIAKQWYMEELQTEKEVTIPHTWNVETDLEEYRGAGWYSYELSLPSELHAKQYRLRFKAVYHDAIIWVNGEKVGEHRNSGYTEFMMDASHAIQANSINRITVYTNNANSVEALPTGNSFDWADDGGLIREVSLIATGAICIDYAMLDAAPNLNSSEGNATLSGRLKISQSEDARFEKVKLAVSLSYQATIIASGEYEAELENGWISLQPIDVNHIQLWHFDHPHLYDVSLTLKANESIQDELKVHVGFREIRTVGHQLFLNGEAVRLMGVEWMPGSHPDYGMAETNELQIRTLEQIKHANCVITRFHWQQDSRLLDWCDRNGLLVQEEIPHWQQPSEPDDELFPVSRAQAEEMIARHYNHPSIYAWGMGNELNGQSAQTIAYMEKLKGYIEGLDCTRLVNYVSNTLHHQPATDATKVGDLLMWNDYIGTWHGDLDQQAVLADIQAAHPNKPLVIAEYGLCEPAFTGGDARRAQILKDKTEIYRKHEQIAALIYFSLNDYRTQMGEEGKGRFMQRVHGSTDIYGGYKPSYWELRKIGAPVIVETKWKATEKSLELNITARGDIPQYNVSGYQLIIRSNSEEQVRQLLPGLKPNENAQLDIVLDAIKTGDTVQFEIVRPTGFSVVAGEIST